MKMKISTGKVILTVVVLIALWYVGSWVSYFHYCTSKRKELQSLPNPVEIAEACRTMLGSKGTNAFANIVGDDPSIPEPLRALKARHVLVREDRLRLEFHGGFDHFGLELHPLDSQCLTGQWDLVYYEERKKMPITSIKWTNYGKQSPAGDVLKAAPEK